MPGQHIAAMLRRAAIQALPSWNQLAKAGDIELPLLQVSYKGPANIDGHRDLLPEIPHLARAIGAAQL